MGAYLYPAASSDELLIRKVTGSNEKAIESLKNGISKKAETMKMEIDLEGLLEQALNSDTSSVFQYKLVQDIGKRSGSMEVFYLKITNKTKGKYENIELDINFCCGKRHFTYNKNTIPSLPA